MKELEKVTLPTDANAQYGYFIIFLGIFAAIPAYYLYFSFRSEAVPTWSPALIVCAVMVLIGMYLILFSKKTVRIFQDRLEMKAGLFSKPLRLSWKGTPRVILRFEEEEYNDKVYSIADVGLIDGKVIYSVERCQNGFLRARKLAESIARALKCDLVERDESSKDTVILADEQSLSFRERMRKYPELKGPQVSRPEGSAVSFERDKRSLSATWGIKSANFVVYAMAGILLVLLIVLLERHVLAVSLEHLGYGLIRTLFYIFLIMIPLSFIIIILFYRIRLTAAGGGVSRLSCLSGLCIRGKSISLDRIRDIRVSAGARGSFIRIFSDSTLLQFDLASNSEANWLCGELQDFLLALDD